MVAIGTKIRIVLADDHPIVVEGVKSLVNAQLRMEVVGEAGDGVSAHKKARELQPDVLILDVSSPHLYTAKITEQVKRDCPKTKVLAFTMHEEKSYMQEILDAGATGYLLKRTTPEELIRAINVVHGGGMYLDPAVAHRFVGAGGRGGRGRGIQRAQLSDRESDVARLIALGYSNKEIGAQMNLSVKTVETYKARLLTKLDLRSRADIVRHAIDHGWLDNNKESS